MAIGVRLRAAGIGFGLILAACSVSGLDPESEDSTISGEAPATATQEAVFQKAEAWLARSVYQVTDRKGPASLSARRTLLGSQDRIGRLEFTTSAPTPTGVKYEIHTWTELLGIQARENDAEMVADAQSLAAALSCPAAKWSTCP